ncbi:structural protein [Xenorhabdus szentirmaii]|uniref:structural protein n=1 Tax=Xenorhabdus szentirmaii TaxID=290112 RepID=UPI0019B693D6|nr:structural protein [Xenorhabdus sp. 38]MBD2779631.1 structural protein [Xenorhabdus sp. 38]
MTRGIRNHNPGNIRHGDKWKGLSETQTDKSFCQFIAPEYGIRAMLRILQNYDKKYKMNTIRQMISRWAPPNENNTEGYIAYVRKSTGIQDNVVLDTNNVAIMTKLIKSIIHMENGQQPYSDAIIEKAFELL